MASHAQHRRPRHRCLSTPRAARLAGFLVILLAATALSVVGVAAQPTAKPANDPLTCLPIWHDVGLPQTPEGVSVDGAPVCHIGYITWLNNTTKTPDWVLERITAAGAAQLFTRAEVAFREETALPDGKKGAVNADYEGSGFDRGHQAASGDFSGDKQKMIDTFFYSNAVPQQGLGFNRHIWAQLEALVQDLARERGELVVITGPINLEQAGITIKAEADACGHAVVVPLPRKEVICEAANRTPAGACTNGVVVPAALFKIIYDPGRGRVNAYVMANLDHRPLRQTPDALAYLRGFRVGVGTVEELTGLRFFTGLDPRAQRILRNSCPATMLH